MVFCCKEGQDIIYKNLKINEFSVEDGEFVPDDGDLVAVESAPIVV